MSSEKACSFIEEVLRGVQLALRPVGWSVLISVLRDADRSDAYRQLQKISAKVDGMLIAEGIVSSEQLARLAARIPIVLAAGSLDEPHADVVDADNWSGTTALARHLLEQHGRTRLFYIAGPPEAPDAQERRRAFEEAVARHPGAIMTGCFEGRFAAISGQLAVREILTAPHRELPDAIVCGNDQMAIGAMRELQAAGIRVPADIAVAGFDDIRSGRPVHAATDHCPPADAAPRRACLLPPAGADRRPCPAAQGRTAAYRAHRQGKLRLPVPDASTAAPTLIRPSPGAVRRRRPGLVVSLGLRLPRVL